jgi:glycosyltransferase involved in cell wall biosynthesis
VLKDFIRAHVEHLAGDKVLVDHWYPDFKHNGRTIRYFHSTAPLKWKLKKLLPHVLYARLVTRNELTTESIRDAFAGFFRAHSVDVVLAEFGPAGADIAPILRDLGIPLVVHFHGHDAHRAKVVEEYAEKYKAMFESAFKIITVSQFMTDTLVALGADREKIVLNPYGPREKFFSATPDYRQTILALGRFTDIKANYLTLAAFAKVAAVAPSVQLVMVGNGELLETCKTLARLWRIDDRVLFAGAVPHAEVLPYFNEACCFVQHSVTPSYGDAEGTPVAVLEASAAALPVVSTRHAGITDVVVHGETGFLVEEQDVEGMALYIQRLVGDFELCRSMGANARHRVHERFNIGTHIARLQQVIDDARRQA